MTNPGQADYEIDKLFDGFDVVLKIDTNHERSGDDLVRTYRARIYDAAELASSEWNVSLEGAIRTARVILEKQVKKFSNLQREPF